MQVLEANNQDERLIAFYAATLESQSAVDAYAQFLACKPPFSYFPLERES